MKRKAKQSQKLIHFDTGIKCHLSIRQEKQMVWSLHKKKIKFGLGNLGGWNFVGFSKSSLEISH